jgi:hypothetical protein
MPRQEFDKSSKYLVQRQGKGILWLGGARDVRLCRALQAELVQPRRLPDGLLEVFFRGRSTPDHVLVEVATYAEKRVLKQALDDLTLAYQQLGTLPELLMLVLRPKGRFQVGGHHEVQSRLQWSQLGCRWRVVEMWTLEAQDLLDAGDVGLVPWVPLTHFEGSPEPVLESCWQRIQMQAHVQDQANLLAVSQIFAMLRFREPELLKLLGGEKAMIESPLVEQLIAKNNHELIEDTLAVRFGVVESELRQQLRAVTNLKKLKKLHRSAVKCADIAAFKAQLLASERSKT